MKTTTLLRSAAWLAVTVSLRADEPLPGTAGWTLTGDPAGAMVEGIHRWLDAKIARGHVAPEGTIDEFRSILGIAADTVQPGPFERQTSGTVTWPVFREVTGEGWLLEPDGPPKAAVLVIPPVDAPADAFPIAELYRRVQARVLVLGRVGRNDGPAGLPDVREARIDRREFLWRAGFELGRTPSSYELQMCLAGLATLGSPHGDGQPALPLAVVDMDRGTLGFRLGRLCPDLKALGVVAGGAGSGTVGETPLDTIVWGEAARTWERLGGGKLWVFPSAKSDMDAGVPHFLLEAIGGPMTALGLDRGKVLSIGREELRGATPDFPDRALADRLYARLLNDTLMTPRNRIAWLDAEAPLVENLAVMRTTPYSSYPVMRGSDKEVLGVLPVKSLIDRIGAGGQFDLFKKLEKPLYVPESTRALNLLNEFRDAEARVALVVDEYGDLQGLVTRNDVLAAIIGAAVHDGAPVHDDAKIVRRADGSYLLDGALKIEDLRDLLELGALPGEDEHAYQTLAGMLIAVLGHIPQVAETYDFDGYRFEVVDLDGARVDKVLVMAIDRKAPELA